MTPRKAALAIAVIALSLTACTKEEPKSLFDKDMAFNFKKDTPEADATGNSPGSSLATPAVNPTGPVQFIRSIKSTSRQVAVDQLSQGNFYESIVSEVEGYRAQIYSDNIGYAIGNGWNVSLQGRGTNEKVGQAIGLPPSQVASLASLSSMAAVQALPVVSISPEQAIKATQVMRAQFEEPIRGLVGANLYDKLQPHQKAALSYHVYKVGPTGAAKFTKLITAVQAYAINSVPELAKKAAEQFTYTYKLNGKVYEDKRSTLYLASLFTDPKAYGYLLGTTAAPANFSSIAKIAGQKIDTKRPADDQINDDFGAAKEKLFEQGIAPTIELDVNWKAMPKIVMVPAYQPTGFYSNPN
ncbi:hypothetical protein [Roseateles sp. PN1]|uniref:hypothetical protein n=1 Tax=Roseateles sp. PN1 TaxID=3137372 RepID=UPI00313895B4